MVDRKIINEIHDGALQTVLTKIVKQLDQHSNELKEIANIPKKKVSSNHKIYETGFLLSPSLSSFLAPYLAGCLSLIMLLVIWS